MSSKAERVNKLRSDRAAQKGRILAKRKERSDYEQPETGTEQRAERRSLEQAARNTKKREDGTRPPRVRKYRTAIDPETGTRRPCTYVFDADGNRIRVWTADVRAADRAMDRMVNGMTQGFARPGDGIADMRGGRREPVHYVKAASGAPRVIRRNGGRKGERLRMGWQGPTGPAPKWRRIPTQEDQ